MGESLAACVCCSKTENLASDHWHPASKGGSDAPENRMILCRRCNTSKGDGAYCTIDHGLEASQEIISPSHRGEVSERADPLETFSTRIRASKKALLLSQSKARGVAAGVIIEELLDDQQGEFIRQSLVDIKQKLDELGTHQAQLPESPTPARPAPDAYAYRRGGTEVADAPVLVPRPVPDRRGWWQRVWARRR